MNNYSNVMPSGVRIISAFPGTGKSSLTAMSDSFVDLDRPDLKTDLPQYISLIRDYLVVPKVTVLLPSWPQLRARLHEENLPFVLFYPKQDLKADYTIRYIRRGSPPALVNTLYDNWDQFIQSCEQDLTPHKVVMERSQAYLSDYFEAS